MLFYTSHFRPISLCNASYNTVTKLLVRRLGCIIDSLVGRVMTMLLWLKSFFILQEIRRVQRWMAIKVDLEKAFDWLNWSFVKNIFEDIELPHWFFKKGYFARKKLKQMLFYTSQTLLKYTPLSVV